MVEPQQIPEDEKICPWLNLPCIKERCKRYSSMQVLEQPVPGQPILPGQPPKTKTIYTCIDNIQLGLLQTLINIMGSSLAQQQMKDIRKFGIPGLPGIDFKGPKG